MVNEHERREKNRCQLMTEIVKRVSEYDQIIRFLDSVDPELSMLIVMSQVPDIDKKIYIDRRKDQWAIVQDKEEKKE